jgi:hypothetical protein
VVVVDLLDDAPQVSRRACGQLVQDVLQLLTFPVAVFFVRALRSALAG